jgi:hypothetical protein
MNGFKLMPFPVWFRDTWVLLYGLPAFVVIPFTSLRFAFGMYSSECWRQYRLFRFGALSLSPFSQTYNFENNFYNFSIPSLYLFIYGSTILLLDLSRFFSFLFLYIVGRTPWTGDQPFGSRYLHTEQHKENKSTQTSMPWVGFEPTIPAFERAKTVLAFDRADTVISFTLLQIKIFIL